MAVGPRAGCIVVLWAAVVLAGCLGGEEAPPEPPAAGLGVTPPSGGPLRFVTEAGEIPIEGVDVEAAADAVLPSTLRLGQLDHVPTDAGALRLVTDGKAFALILDQSVRPYDAGTVVYARVFEVDGNRSVASGMWAVPGEAVPLRVPVGVHTHTALRFGAAYAYDVWVVAPTGPPDCRCALQEGSAEGYRFSFLGAVQGAEGAAAPHRETRMWNATLLHHHAGPVAFRPTWALSFEGPGEGGDRPNAVEEAVFQDPEVGAYTITVQGTRIWLADVLMEFGNSKVAGTEPHVYGNGSRSLQFQLDGWRPLEAYLEMPAGKGLEQSFSMRVDVDYETKDDLPGEEEQLFFLTASIGYRFAGSTYVAGTAGKDIAVRVTGGA